MKRVMRALSVAAIAMVAMNAGAQEKPNFAGRWNIRADSAASGRGAAGRGGRSGDMGSGWGSTITITQDAARLTVEYAFFSRGDMQAPLKFVYALDGSETKNSVMMGRGMQEQSSKTAWNGVTLVITTLHPFQNPATGEVAKAEVRQALSLESPTSLIVETTRAGVLGGPSSTTRTVYSKN